MAPILLRKGQDWCHPKDGLAVDRFHAIARQSGSEARWLCQSCVLATGNLDEPEKNFPYELWRDNALK